MAGRRGCWRPQLCLEPPLVAVWNVSFGRQSWFQGVRGCRLFFCGAAAAHDDKAARQDDKTAGEKIRAMLFEAKKPA